jgi:F-type H+-transporting ATPase subunit gamma
MATLRELKGRIGSVASSEKITGAMKMISSAKMHKAEGALRRLVPFRSQIETIIGNLLSSDAQFNSALVTERPEIKHMCVVVWGSDDGLCGAYNVNIYKRLIALIGELRQQVGNDAQIAVMPIGRKITAAVSKLKAARVSIVDAPADIDSKTAGDKVNNFIGSLQQQFETGQYDRIDVLYMNFITAGRQRPKNLQLLPVLPDTFTTNGKAATGRPYLFEPDANSIFNTVLPMYLMAAMQDVFTQNRASEAAARVMAMQSANDNAKTLLEQLQLEYNKLRQQSITNELLDIVGGQVHD